VQGKKEFNQRIYYNINLDCLVPEDHLLKRLERLISFDFVRDITRDYYSHTGKPSIDPVVLVKMLLVGYLFDIRSERKLVEEISLNLAYRWYIGYDLDEEVPNHSVFSKARVRFGKKLFVDIFEKILLKCIELGLVSSEGMLIDSTIVKANASDGSMVEINLSPEQYWKRLDRPDRPKKKLVGDRFAGEVDKNKMGKRTRDINRLSLRKKSTTDPDATIVHKPGRGSHLSYKAHIATDTNGIITAVSASPSVSHDTGAVPDLIEAHEKILGTPSWIAADTKYGSEECLKYLQDKNIKTAIRPETKNTKPGYFPKNKFRYDSSRDCYVCPNGKLLKRRSKNYPQNRINYSSNKKDCNLCPVRKKCISGKGSFRIVSHYDSPCYGKARGWYDSGYGQIMQKLRHTVIEGVFGQAKTYHGMAKARFRGLKKVEMQFLMTATALNLKKMVKMLDIEEVKSSLSIKFTYITRIVKDIFKNFIKKLAIEGSLATSP
jgi:transposase